MAVKGPLGKGMEALLSDFDMDMGQNRPSLLSCGIEEIVPNRFQPRRDFPAEEQRQLVDSIKENGIIQPIVVRRIHRGYEIIAGERRWRAAQAAGLQSVPIVVREAEDRDIAELSLVENIQRESLNPLEEAAAYDTLTRQFGLSQEDIAQRVGKDRSTVANALRLLKLPQEAKKALVDKAITSGHARALLSLDRADHQSQALRQIVARGLNVREAERLALRIQSRQAGKRLKKDPSLQDVEKRLTAGLQTRVSIRKGRKSGTIEIHFSSNEEMDRLILHLLNATEP